MEMTQTEVVRSEDAIVEAAGEMCVLGEHHLAIVGGGIADPLFL